MLFKQKKFSDERIVHMQNKIYREIYMIITIICFASIGIKFLTVGRELNFIITELIILLLSGFYYQYRSVKLGIFSDEVEISNANSKFPYSTRTIAGSAVLGVLIGIAFGLNSAFNYANSTSQAISYFFSVFFISIMIYVPVLLFLFIVPHNLSKRQSDKVNRKMLEELDDDDK